MKNKKFKLERNVLLEVSDVLKLMLTRVRAIIPHVELKYESCFNTLMLYYNSILNYLNEIENFLSAKGKSVLISKEEFDKINNLKNIISFLEKEIDYYPFISFKMH